MKELVVSPQVRTGLLAAVLLVTLANTVMIVSMDAPSGEAPDAATADATFTLPTGSPDYAADLDVSFDAVSEETPQEAEETIRTLAMEDRRELTAAERDRLVTILHDMEGGISCEYCCEVESIVTEDGRSGCGCSHAVAMRGLTKHLIQETDMTDREIFEDVSKWKVRFFPGQSEAKFDGLQEQGIEPTFINLASNSYRGVSAGGGWVGDC